MLRDLLICVLIGLLAGTGGCAGPTLIVQSDGGKAMAVGRQRVRPVEYTKDDLQVAMATFAEHLTAVVQQRETQLHLRLASADARVEAYLIWCARGRTPGDCLGLLDARTPDLSVDAMHTIALRTALAYGLREAAEVVRNVDPVKVEALIVIWFTVYLASLVFPDVTLTKALTVIMTANMVAFLGWDGFHNIIQGYREMSKDVDDARTFQQVLAAGERYGRRMGASMVRIVTALATWGLSATMGMARPVTDLPRGAQAVANAEVQGFRVLAVADGSVTVSASGSVTLVLAAQATIPEGSGVANQQHSTEIAPLKRFDIDKYGRFNASCRVGDELCGHEVLQSGWLREHGYAARRGADASRDNPAIAVDPPLHDRIAVEQRKLGLFERENLARMTAEENIQLNAQAMRAAGVPETCVRAIVERAFRYAASLPR